jgi:hypothetical protein
MPRGRPRIGKRWGRLRQEVLALVERSRKIQREDLLEALARKRGKRPSHRAFALVMKQLKDDEMILSERDSEDRRRIWYSIRKKHGLPLEKAALVVGLLEFWRLTTRRALRRRIFEQKRIGAVQLRSSISRKMDSAIDLGFYSVLNQLIRGSYSETIEQIRLKQKRSQAHAELCLHATVSRMIKRNSRWVHSTINDLLERSTNMVLGELAEGRIPMETLIAMRHATEYLQIRSHALGREPPYT